MAFVENIFIHSSDMNSENFTAHVRLKPAGRVMVTFKMPDKFHQCILDAAQAAADLYEQQMKAEILADKEKKEDA